MVQFVEALNLAIYRPKGVFEKNAVADLLAFLQSMETAIPSTFNRLLDLSGIVEIQLTGTDLFRFAKARRSAAEKIAVCRSAIFAPTLLTFAIAKIYEELMEGSNIQVGVFSDVKPVAEWLGLPESALGLQNKSS